MGGELGNLGRWMHGNDVVFCALLDCLAMDGWHFDEHMIAVR